MAKNPRKPDGVSDDAETKRAAYGNYGSYAEDVGNSVSRVREPGRPDREPWQGENRVERAPVRPIVRQWASPSYDPDTGRANRVETYDFMRGAEARQARKPRDDKPESWKQVPDAGDSTTRHTDNRKGRSRPGRW